MRQKLSEMTLEEFWRLFPIILTPHNPSWRDWYDDERRILQSSLPQERILRISHIGSTAIPIIQAKPIVDILVEAKSNEDFDELVCYIPKAGYLRMSKTADRASFNKGYTEAGFAKRVFHLHLRKPNDNDELYFRDYLNSHPLIAQEYERLKLKLWNCFEYNRDAYTEGKTNFVVRHTFRAKKLYTGRY